MRGLRVVLLIALAGATIPLAASAHEEDHALQLPDDATPVNGTDRCDPGTLPSSTHTSIELAIDGTTLPQRAEPVLRFVQLSDSHIIDDDGPDAANGTPTEVVLDPMIGNTSATFLNEEYTDEVLNAMIATINACQAVDDLALTITTGDITDTNWLNVVRRVIDNVAGDVAPTTAFEEHCGYVTHDSSGAPKAGAPAECPIPAELLAIPTGRLVNDAADQSGLTNEPGNGPSVEEDATYQLGTTRALRQALESAATPPPPRSATITTRLPPTLACAEAAPGCDNVALDTPYYAVFGNHDVSVKGTVTYQGGFGPALAAFGRYFFESKREFINEWFHSGALNPGHGFQHAGSRLLDADDRNDGWYSFPVPMKAGNARFIVLDTTYDGVEQAIHRSGQTGADTGGHLAGNEVTDPGGLEAGFVSDAQLAWLADQLAAAAAADEPVLVFSHHPDRSFVERQYPWAAHHVEATAVEIDELLGRAAHGGNPSTVLAWVAGHTHANRVNPCRPGDCPIGSGSATEAHIERGFWRFETASLIDWPQEGRIVELFDLGRDDVTGTVRYGLRLTMLSPDQNRSAAARSRTLSGFEAMCSVNQMMGGPLTSGPYDQQRLEAFVWNTTGRQACPGTAAVRSAPGTAAGGPLDRDVLLLP